MDLTTKRIIVTGCASGMGAATVRAYVAGGASVIGMDVSDDAGSIVCADAAASSPGTATYLSADVADGDRVEAAFDAAAELMGGLDVLAHPAAIHASSDASEVTIADWGHMCAERCAPIKRHTAISKPPAEVPSSTSARSRACDRNQAPLRIPRPRAQSIRGLVPRPPVGAETRCG